MIHISSTMPSPNKSQVHKKKKKISQASVVVKVRMDMIVIIVRSIPGRHGHSEHKKRLLSERLLREIL
jgi:hypothetical protein